MFPSSAVGKLGDFQMKSMFTVTLSGEAVSVVVSSNGDGAIQLTKRLLDLEDRPENPRTSRECAMLARQPTHQESDVFFARQKAWTGAARMAGLLL
jgi:hypothetical protein